jgi:methyltransferase (TIGR00027 family)
VSGISQAVILAAGMDARSYRLPWREGATVFEVDQPRVIAMKDERLAGEQPRCRRVAVGVDLAEDWPKVLVLQGFDSATRTVWLIEGLLQCLEAPDVERLFARVDTLSGPGSVLLYDGSLRSVVLGCHLGVHGKARCAMGFQQRRAGCSGRGARLDHDRHRYGRTRPQMETLGTPAGSG